MSTTLITMTITLFVASAIAALPLLKLRQFRAAMQGTLGSLCLTAGCGAFIALCSGFLGEFGSANLFAADVGAKAAIKELPSKSPTKDTSPATSAADKALAEDSTHDVKLPAGELHTAPNVNPERMLIPPGRPEWIGRNVSVGSEHTIAVCSGPFTTEAEAEHELDRVIKAKTDEYIAERLGSSLAPQLVGYDIIKIKTPKNEHGLGLLKPENIYREEISLSVGPMHQVHALLEFDPDFRQKITNQWHDLTAYYRLLQTGLVAGGALLFLGTVFSYFRLDNATRGYYTGRLQFMTAAAILAIVGSGAVLARWIYWL